MPRIAKELSALDVKRLQHPGRGRNATFNVGGVAGLVLQITPNGGRTWLLRVLVGTKRREIGLGGYPEVTLGVRLIEPQSQNMTVAARATADRKVLAHLS